MSSDLAGCIYSRVLLKRGPIYPHITVGTGITATEHKLGFKITTPTRPQG